MALVTYLFVCLFLILIVYIGKFITQDNSILLSNSYNKRQDLMAERIVRGKIYSNKKEVLAETQTNKKGNEIRVYPYKNLFSHVVGRNSHTKTGIEASHNFYLLRSTSNPLFAFFNEVSGEKNKGDNVVTTLDVTLQAAAFDGLGDRKGAVIAMEPSTGKILAMVSKPDYDTNQVDQLWSQLIEEKSEESRLLNRATQGLYPPGSTFKLLTALEYMRENPNFKDFHYQCRGSISVDGSKISCYNNKAHGNVTLRSAIAKSCNSAFAKIGLSLDVNKLTDLCNRFYFNQDLPTNFEHSNSSFVLATGDPSSDVMQTAIGQGKTSITPLHNAMILSSIVNQGSMMKPYVVDRVENQDNRIVKQYQPEKIAEVATKEESDTLMSDLIETVKTGTATRLRTSSYVAGGKTGSAEYSQDKSSHAWFIGFAEKNGQTIVVSVIVEGAGTGGEFAVPIAKKIFDAYW